MTAKAIRNGWERPQPLPMDFVFTAVHVERTKIAHKEEGVSVSIPVSGYGASNSVGYTLPAYFIFVMTKNGDLQITVSKKVFDLLRVGDPIIVRYHRGRWTGALKGKIAR